MSSRTRDAVLGLFGAHPKGPGAHTSTRLILDASDAIGLSVPAVRVALTRMQRGGLLESTQRGEYALTPVGRTLAEGAQQWESIASRTVRWRGSWAGVAVGDLPAAAGRARPRERALRRHGFRLLQRGLFVRTDNLEGGIEALRAALASAGLEPSADVFSIRDLELTARRVDAMWNVDKRAREQRSLAALLSKSRERLLQREERRALHESFHLGRRAIAAVLRDPLLPPDLVDARPRRELLAELRSYRRASLRIWTRFVRRPR